MPRRSILFLSLLSAVVMLVMVNFTTPTGVGPFGVLVFFAAFYLLTFGICTLFVRMFARILGKKLRKKEYLYAAIVAFGPIMLMLAQSMGSVNAITVSLTFVFVALACFLVSKRG